MRVWIIAAVVAACSSPPATTTPEPRSSAPTPPASPPPPPPPPLGVDPRTAELIHDVNAIDDSSLQSIETAVKAADELGKEHAGAAADALIALAHRPPTKMMATAEVAAIRALGRLDNDKAKLAAGLVGVLDRPPPPRQPEEGYTLYLMTTGSAMNALAELRVPPNAIKPLVLAMYRAPELFVQARRALVIAGPPAKAELVRALRGEIAEVNQMFKDRQPPVSARQFYAAVLLGDFHDPAVVPDLVAALASPPLPAYYDLDQPSPTTQHGAIFDALLKLGSQSAADTVRAMWQSPSADVTTRALAVAAYPFVARDAADAPQLGAIAADNRADDTLRQEAATALARLSRDPKDIVVLQNLAKRYLDASAKKAGEAAKLTAGAQAADREFEAKKRTATTDAERRLATRQHKDRIAPFKAATSAEKAYRGYARMFQTHIAGIEIAGRCGTTAACYATALTVSPDLAMAPLKRFIADWATWTADEKAELVPAAKARALIELGKLGPAAAAYTDAVLDAAGNDDRMVRRAALLALPHVAKLPCPSCTTKLDAVLAADENKPLLADLTGDTRVVREYFSWATP